MQPALNTIDPDLPSTEYVFKRIFFVRVPQQSLESEGDIRQFGSRSTGFAKYDNQIFGQMTSCYLTIAQMASIHDRGFGVQLVHYEDAKTVYEFVQHHLDTWMKFITGTLNTAKAPFEDLRVLDRFATSVYGVAAHQYTTPDNLTTFGRWMSQFADLSDTAFNAPATEETKEADIKSRPSLQDALLEHQARMFG